MRKTIVTKISGHRISNGWQRMPDEPGKISYKYIVDGVWMTDPENKDTEIDGQNTNSVKNIDK